MMEIKKPMTENEKKNGNLLYKYLMKNDVVSKEQMLNVLGWDSKKDRQLRDLLSMIGKKKPLIATSDQRGYKIAKTKDDLEEVRHQYNELMSRIENLRERVIPLSEFYKQIQGEN